MGALARWVGVLTAVVVLAAAASTADRSDAQQPAPGVPILLYHHVATAPKRAASPALYVPAALFRRQMAALSDAGYTAVTMAQVVAAWDGGEALPDKPVVVSFDDGYTDQYTAARPVLRELGWPGVLYLVARNTFPQRISTAQVRGLLAADWELGAHTMTHPDLTKVSPTKLKYEVAGSRSALASRYGVPVDAFAYPNGHVNNTVERAVEAAGFSTATTTKAGLARPEQDRARLPRLIVTPRTTPAQLVAKVAGAG